MRDGETLKFSLTKLPSSGLASAANTESPFDCLPLLAECLKLKDSSLLYLEVSGLIKKYPDVNEDHLTALLSLREDMAKTNVRKVSHAISSIKSNISLFFTLFHIYRLFPTC